MGKSKITSPNFRKLVDGIKKLQGDAPRMAGAKAVAFFKDSFKRQGWVYNASLKRWEPRKQNQGKQRAILIKTGRLRRSIRIMATTATAVKVGSDVPYAEAHNEGAEISAAVTVRSHRRRTRKGTTTVNSHRRRVHHKIPRRQFIGHSPDLMKSIEREFTRAANKVMNEAWQNSK